MSEKSQKARIKRHARIRKKIAGTPDRPRLNVFRSHKHIYAQVIDDVEGHTVASASTIDLEMRGQTDGKSKTEQSVLVGKLVAERALDVGVKMVVFDTGGYKYHGRVKALAEAAREAGLDF